MREVKAWRIVPLLLVIVCLQIILWTPTVGAADADDVMVYIGDADDIMIDLGGTNENYYMSPEFIHDTLWLGAYW